MRNLIKRYGMFITGIIIGALLTTGLTAFAASILSADYNANKIIFNGQTLTLDRPMISVVDDEMQSGAFANYMPVRAVLEAMGYTVDWDSENSAVIVTSSDYAPIELTLSQTVNISVMGSPVDVFIRADKDFTLWELNYTVMGTDYFAKGTFDADMTMTVVEANGSRFASILPSIQEALTEVWK